MPKKWCSLSNRTKTIGHFIEKVNIRGLKEEKRRENEFNQCISKERKNLNNEVPLEKVHAELCII